MALCPRSEAKKQNSRELVSATTKIENKKLKKSLNVDRENFLLYPQKMLAQPIDQYTV